MGSPCVKEPHQLAKTTVPAFGRPNHIMCKVQDIEKIFEPRFNMCRPLKLQGDAGTLPT